MNIKLNNNSSENKQINTKEYVIDTKMIMVVTGKYKYDLIPKNNGKKLNDLIL